ncbi:MAG TPA: pentapeptide repeat-containing protein [Solirubrobacteraceae bacterium]|nr:pentapeptide repeat-containing protein [Solirubrobacteraceae bacterium]
MYSLWTSRLVREGAGVGRKPSIEEILSAIEDNRGPGGLPLNDINLSDLDLSGAILLDIRPKQVRPVWLTDRLGHPGLNLIGAVLRRTEFVHATLDYARLQLADLRDSDLYGASLVGVDMYRANLRGADLYKANLERAKLERADLRGADLRFANLRGANLLRANLDGALVYGESFGHALLQENADEYSAYLLDDRRIIDFALAVEQSPRAPRSRLYPLYGVDWMPLPDEPDIRRRHESQRFVESAEIYRTLQACFLQQGRTSDAAWAYLRERRAERRSNSPRNVRREHADQFRGMPGWRMALSAGGYIVRWLRDCFYELLAGYGERPVRPFAGIALTFVAFTAAFAILGEIGSPLRAPGLSRSVILSASSMVSVGFSDVAPGNDLTKMLSVAEAAIGIALFALGMFSLGNQMRRR